MPPEPKYYVQSTKSPKRREKVYSTFVSAQEAAIWAAITESGLAPFEVLQVLGEASAPLPAAYWRSLA